MRTESYARFLKCDLHMHSPMDPSWRDDATRPRPRDSDDRKRDVAREYLRACHGQELDVIAITDHNFAESHEHSFIKWLREENEGVAERDGRHPLVIFPGFEVEASVGKGCHVLCLFDPDADLVWVDGFVSQLGLKPGDRFSGAQPQRSNASIEKLLATVQECSSEPREWGLVIPAHVLGDKGLLADSSADLRLQQSEWTRGPLLSVELTEPVERHTPALQKLLGNGPDCWPEWKRRRDMAYVTCSDAKRLRPECGEQNPANHIGYRYTWMKMSAPWIEALRQAFLDPGSRIRLGGPRPEDAYDHPRITRVSVRGARFLRDVDVEFSPNLNCVIGGRGSGKSTLVEYIRWALGLEPRPGDDMPQRVRERVTDLIEGTLCADAHVQVELQAASDRYVVTRSKGDAQPGVVSASAGGPVNLVAGALSQARQVSQGQIDALAEDRDSLPAFLDRFLVSELSDLAAEANRARDEIRSLDLKISALVRDLQRKPGLETDLEIVTGLLSKHKEAAPLLAQLTALATEEELLRAAISECEAVPQHLEDALLTPHLAALLDDATLLRLPHGDKVREAGRATLGALDRLRADVRSAAATYADCGRVGHGSSLREVLAAQTQPRRAEVEESLQALAPDAQEGKAERAPGASATMADEAEPADEQASALQNLAAEQASLRAQLATLEERGARREELVRERAKALDSLWAVWRRETEARRRKAFELMGRLAGPGGGPTVDIQVTHQGDRTHALTVLCEGLDRRRLNENDLVLVVGLVGESADPCARGLLQRLAADLRAGASSRVLTSTELTSARRAAVEDLFAEDRLAELELTRLNDTVEMIVHNPDGTVAGTIQKASTGQRGAAILSLLLAEGEGPLIVDTPEEHLDSAAVYSSLVPTFREQKETRQLILVTHNANIPVNADAEAIIPLEASGSVTEEQAQAAIAETGRATAEDGVARVVAAVERPDWENQVRRELAAMCRCSEEQAEAAIRNLALERAAFGRLVLARKPGGGVGPVQGALDNPDVSKIVQDVMEGSEEAFRRRREKYGF